MTTRNATGRKTEGKGKCSSSKETPKKLSGSSRILPATFFANEYIYYRRASYCRVIFASASKVCAKRDANVRGFCDGDSRAKAHATVVTIIISCTRGRSLSLHEPEERTRRNARSVVSFGREVVVPIIRRYKKLPRDRN